MGQLSGKFPDQGPAMWCAVFSGSWSSNLLELGPHLGLTPRLLVPPEGLNVPMAVVLRQTTTHHSATSYGSTSGLEGTLLDVFTLSPAGLPKTHSFDFVLVLLLFQEMPLEVRE